MKQLRFLSYIYPNQVRLLIGGVSYTFESSEFFCRRFIASYEKGGRFNALNWFKRYARVIEKEVNKYEKVVC